MKWTTIGASGELKSGGTPSRKVLAYWNGGIPWVKTSEVKNCIINKTEETISKLGLKESSACIAPIGAVLVAMFGQGRTRGQVAQLGVEAAFNQACVAIVWNHDVDTHFAFHYLQHSYESLRKFSQTGSQANLNATIIRDFPFPKTSHPYQRACGCILNEFQNSAWRISRAVDRLCLRNKVLFNELLTGSRRSDSFVKSLSKKHHAVRSSIDWQLVPVASVAHEVHARPPECFDGHVLSSTKHDGLVDSLEYFGRRVYSEDTSNYKLVKRGQFAYATNHIEEGSIGLLTHRDEGLVSPMYTVFETNDEVIPEFLFPLFKSDRYLHLFRAMTNGSVNRRGGLRWNDFKTIKVALPSIAEQRRIVELLDLLDKEITLLRRLKSATEKQKRGVLERLLTGEVTIPDHVVERLNAEAESEKRKQAKAVAKADGIMS